MSPNRTAADLPGHPRIDAAELAEALRLGENEDWEFKSGRGGVPASLWESYSAMANTDGGTIVLGVVQKGDRFEVQGLSNPQGAKQRVWNDANNRGVVSVNLMSNADVAVERAAENEVLVIRVPRADRRQRPVYVGQNPLIGTYRRYNEGDYHCPEKEVGRMLADRSDEPADAEALIGFDLTDLDSRSLEQYRNRFSSRAAGHPWLGKDDRGLLGKLGGWRDGRDGGPSGLTVAGLLMFGTDEALRDSAARPEYHVDYREYLPDPGDPPPSRWTDRVWRDGTWAGNLFQFFHRVYPRLVADLKVPFQYGTATTKTPSTESVQRRDDTAVHEAVREAFVNALIHADFGGTGGVVVERHRDRLVFSNPGTLLVPIDQMRSGGVSQCRNKKLQLMFQMIGYGEQAGSGIDKIVTGWGSQRWRWPQIEEQVRPARVRLTLPMVSLLPEESLSRLRDALGTEFSELTSRDAETLVTADREGWVTNPRLQLLSHDHASDITKRLGDLCGRKLLVKEGHGRGTAYRLHDRIRNSPQSGGTPHTTGATPHTRDANSPHNGDDASDSDVADRLRQASEAVRERKRLPPDESRGILLLACSAGYVTPQQLSEAMSRNAASLSDRFLQPMAEEGLLERQFPHEKHHPKQAYRATPAGVAAAADTTSG